MTKTSYELATEARALRNLVINGQTNQTPIMAWAAVCRACTKAEDAHRRERGDYLDLTFLTRLGELSFDAWAQLETLRRAA